MNDPFQLCLPMLTRIDAPSVVHPKAVASIQSYRDAVRKCWEMRRDKSDGAQSACARYMGAQVSHMSSYLSDDPEQRDMPAKFIKAFQFWCGVTVISQYLARVADLSVNEEVTVMLKEAQA